jgi:hypothetical protein
MKFIVITMFDRYNSAGSVASCMVECGLYRISTIKLQYLCGLVYRVPGCKSRDPGSISGATRLSEK